MDNLGDKLGPLLLQFGFFNTTVFRGVSDFLARLKPFLKKLPKDHKFAVEIRNKAWLVPQFIEGLREHGVALALIDQSWMPRPAQWFEKLDPITADFTYVRLLGDRGECLRSIFAGEGQWHVRGEVPQARRSDARHLMPLLPAGS